MGRRSCEKANSVITIFVGKDPSSLVMSFLSSSTFTRRGKKKARYEWRNWKRREKKRCRVEAMEYLREDFRENLRENLRIMNYNFILSGLRM